MFYKSFLLDKNESIVIALSKSANMHLYLQTIFLQYPIKRIDDLIRIFF